MNFSVDTSHINYGDVTGTCLMSVVKFLWPGLHLSKEGCRSITPSKRSAEEYACRFCCCTSWRRKSQEKISSKKKVAKYFFARWLQKLLSTRHSEAPSLPLGFVKVIFGPKSAYRKTTISEIGSKQWTLSLGPHVQAGLDMGFELHTCVDLGLRRYAWISVGIATMCVWYISLTIYPRKLNA